METAQALRLARSEAIEDRQRAATTLASAREPAAVEVLRELLDDSDTAVVQAAAQALVTEPDDVAAELLFETVTNADLEVGEEVLWAIHEAVGRDSIDVVRRAERTLESSSRTAAKIGAVETLAWLRPEAAAPVLMRFARSCDDLAIAETAAAAARKLENPPDEARDRDHTAPRN